MSQIFFNCLVTELFVAATFNDTSTTTPPICVKNMSHPRWAPNETLGNASNVTEVLEAEGRRLGVKVAGEAAAVDMTGMYCYGGGNLMVLTMIVTGMSEVRLPSPNHNTSLSLTLTLTLTLPLTPTPARRAC